MDPHLLFVKARPTEFEECLLHVFPSESAQSSSRLKSILHSSFFACLRVLGVSARSVSLTLVTREIAPVPPQRQRPPDETVVERADIRAFYVPISDAIFCCVVGTPAHIEVLRMLLHFFNRQSFDVLLPLASANGDVSRSVPLSVEQEEQIDSFLGRLDLFLTRHWNSRVFPVADSSIRLLLLGKRLRDSSVSGLSSPSRRRRRLPLFDGSLCGASGPSATFLFLRHSDPVIEDEFNTTLPSLHLVRSTCLPSLLLDVSRVVLSLFLTGEVLVPPSHAPVFFQLIDEIWLSDRNLSDDSSSRCSLIVSVSCGGFIHVTVHDRDDGGTPLRLRHDYVGCVRDYHLRLLGHCETGVRFGSLVEDIALTSSEERDSQIQNVSIGYLIAIKSRSLEDESTLQEDNQGIETEIENQNQHRQLHVLYLNSNSSLSLDLILQHLETLMSLSVQSQKTREYGVRIGGSSPLAERSSSDSDSDGFWVVCRRWRRLRVCVCVGEVEWERVRREAGVAEWWERWLSVVVQQSLRSRRE